jgi:hypothetical protein
MEEEIADIVQQYGWYAASIYDHNPPFLYSIGLMQTYNHPEFIVFGLDAKNAYALLSALIQSIRAGQSFAQSGVHTVSVGGNDHRVGFRPVHQTQHPLYLRFAMGYCRHIGRWGELQTIQLFWTDSQGKFPFDVGCNLDMYRLQPRLDLALTPSEIRRFQRLWE